MFANDKGAGFVKRTKDFSQPSYHDSGGNLDW